MMLKWEEKPKWLVYYTHHIYLETANQIVGYSTSLLLYGEINLNWTMANQIYFAPVVVSLQYGESIFWIQIQINSSY